MKDWQAQKAKNILRGICWRNAVYYNRKKKELRVKVGEWQDGDERHEENENDRIVRILNALSENGIRPKFRQEVRRYQGFINCRYIVFE